MIRSFINSISNDSEALLKFLLTIYGEYSDRLDKISMLHNKSQFEYGQMDIMKSILDYFDLDFLNENFKWLFENYGKKYFDLNKECN